MIARDARCGAVSGGQSLQRLAGRRQVPALVAAGTVARVVLGAVVPTVRPR